MKKTILFFSILAISLSINAQVLNTNYGVSSGEPNNTDSNHNSFFGFATGQNAETEATIAIGNYAGQHATDGSFNQFLGYNSGRHSIGDHNTFLGYATGQNTSGNNNTFVGNYAGIANTTGTGNIFMGYQTGYKSLDAHYNVYLGYAAGHENINGGKNVFLGYKAGFYETSSNKLYIDNSDTTSPLIYGDFNNDELTVNGNLSIGARESTDDSALAVNGTIHSKEVKVDLDFPPDYVFQKYYTGSSNLKSDYKMPTLEEIEAYTKKNHHLPEIPSAKEIQNNGLHLKEMTALLLQKIEELTLYTIEQEKRIKSLEAKLEK